MKRALIGSVSALLFSAVISAQGTAQQTPPPPPPTPPQQAQPQTQAEPKAQELTLVGCVSQGTSSDVFIFEDALDPAKKDQKPQTFRIVSTGEGMDFTPHLNHKVQVIGTVAAAKTPPTPPVAGQKVDEKDLPVFTVKTVSMVATTCSAAGQ